MTERWNSESTIKFVQEYGKHACLWDATDNSYRNKCARQSAVQKIANEMNLEGFDVRAAKKKIRIIRSTYWNEVTKIRKSIESGGTPYKPKMPWFNIADSYLKRVTNIKESKFIMTPDEFEEFYSEEIEASQIDETSDENCKEKVVTGKRKRLKTTEDPLDIKASAILEEIATPSEDDEFSAFGKSIAIQLSKLPLEDAIELQMQFQNMLFERRLSVIRRRAKFNNLNKCRCNNFGCQNVQQTNNPFSKDDGVDDKNFIVFDK